MARLDWGETQGETLHMIKATVQTHENLLFGSTEEKIEGIVPVVNELMVKIKFSKNLGILLNVLILLMLAIMTYRNESRPPTVVYQQVPQSYQRKSYNVPPIREDQDQPQDAAIPPLAR